MNLLELRNQVLLMESQFSTRTRADMQTWIDSAINTSLLELASRHKWSWLLTELSISVAASTSRVSMPKDISKIGWLYNSDSKKLGMAKFDDLKWAATEIDASGQQKYGQGVTRYADFYNTGSVTVTNGSATVTGSGTSWDSTMVGRIFEVSQSGSGSYNPHPQTPLIASVESATSLTLADSWRETTAAAGSLYKIDPSGTRELLFVPTLTTAETLTLYYFRKPRKLRNDSDSPVEIPEEFHPYLYWDVRAKILHGTEERETLRQEAAQRAAELLSLMKQHDSDRTLNSVKARVFE